MARQPGLWTASLRSNRLAVLLALILAGPMARAMNVWSETGDAGDLLATANDTTGPANASLDRITGAYRSDTADVYRIYIKGGGTFSATTVGGANWDTVLTLFDQNGRGVYQNDDTVVGVQQSKLPANDPRTPLLPGIFYLAISRFDADPTSTGPLGPLAIFPNGAPLNDATPRANAPGPNR